MSQTDIHGFFWILDKSKLLGADSAEQLWQKASAESAAASTVEGFAVWLLQHGKVTEYQADKLLRGQTRFFLDDYKLMDHIGAGRMAGVYRAIHKLGMPVAVKVLPPSGSKKAEVLARFQREAELALQLDHPHVVKTYHAGVSGGLHYIAMEFLEGETLEDRLKKHVKLSPEETMRFADQALQALGHLQEKGMVHRDVKPGNFMLVSLPVGATGDNPYSAKLLDVGLGRALFTDEEEAGPELTTAGTVIGTPDYTAPEQSRNSHAADIRSDLYGLGCVLYECLTGRVPFPDKNLVNKLIKHAQEMPPPLDLGGYPRTAELQEWLWNLIAKSPGRRFQTPAEAAAALQPLLRAKASTVPSAPADSLKRVTTNEVTPDPTPFDFSLDDPVPVARPVQKHPTPAPPIARPVQKQPTPAAAKAPVKENPSATRRPPWRYIAVGSGAFLVLILASYLIFSSQNESKQKPPTGQDKAVASVTPPVEETQPRPKPAPKNVKGPAKKTEPEPVVVKKTEPEPKEPPKKTEPEPVVVVKKTEPEPKDPPKKTEPVEPPAKKEELKKEFSDDRRLPVPPADQIAQAEKMIKDVFGADYAKTKPAERLALATKLLEEAGGTKGDNVRYVMLRDSRNIAATVGNATLAMTAAQEITNSFQASPSQAISPAAEMLAAANVTPATATDSAEALFGAVDTARAADDWQAAVALARAADSLARKSQSAVLAALAQAKLKEIETIKAEFDKIKDRIAALAANVEDPAANLAVGRFRCLIKQDWEMGLGLLAKGPDSPLKAAADLDVKAAAGNEDDKAAAADAWYDLARTANPNEKFAMQSRAHYWYSEAQPKLTGLDKVKAEKRMVELQAVLDVRGGRLKLWTANRQAVVDGQIKKWDLSGGTPAMKDFEEISKDGAILIGFYYYINRNPGDPPEALLPIYMSPRGEVKGAAYGATKNADAIRVTKAKQGYAIGAIYVRTNPQTRVLAVKPIYMKITDKGLDPNNRYVGPQIGGDIGDGGMVGGDGNFIVGIHGKMTLDNLVGALSVVTLTTQEPVPLAPDPKKK